MDLDGRESGKCNENGKEWWWQQQSDWLYFPRLVKIVAGLGKEYVVWQDVVDSPVKVLPHTIIDVWRPGSNHGWQPEMARITGKLGLKAVLSSCWYLDLISYGQDWPKVISLFQISWNMYCLECLLCLAFHVMIIWLTCIVSGNHYCPFSCSIIIVIQQTSMGQIHRKILSLVDMGLYGLNGLMAPIYFQELGKLTLLQLNHIKLAINQSSI